ncbi:bifunctional 5,10-methylenetetrahydrofolate dehydrogenase/5,10-methenyltetrahydrofolate cyclohydrolase [Dyadobacter subterraneus]|uniref:Bifunctional protein FolD n=1 Tax=Dyadobacter subterraneus TaxID=2773304 RepID=A0ABR9W758_9BACT|nr:bifunctional 5,10-methylenetetrahydrofolate dehydrogenase/5,10-methenyltetrahydrofolate cyclohydrolase [Dyadobacter subterraneus]MBE9461302.1 bifunctional 5,10-methylenetetrahydrofolate dehydrogenase/5,10-methenyltetrahydrofolate cyclohydrolase [Dyadobacter subterraneus]
MQLLDGKIISEKFKIKISEEVVAMRKNSGKQPHLAAVLVGNHGASETYVASKMKNCEIVGFKSTLIKLENKISEEELIKKILELNENNDIDGIIVQLPLPAHINPEKITECIDYRKDVDGFHPVNLGRMQRNLSSFIPATPYGIMLMLEEYGIKTEGRHCVVVGRSNIVGLPMSILMARDSNPGNCTVTLCHIYTPEVKLHTSQADILIVAVGKRNFITADMVKPGAVVIDVGINPEISRQTKTGYKLYGDVDFDKVSSKTSWITPVPGGVGPMTITALLKNTLLAAKQRLLYADEVSLMA